MTRVDELILQLQDLQVQQKELTAQLAEERKREQKANKTEPEGQGPQGFRIGQGVIVTTASGPILGRPSPAGSHGTITTITAKRVQIRLADGRLTRRAPINVRDDGDRS